MKYFIIIVMILFSCNSSKSPNDLGRVEFLPKGEYVIWNKGSRHIVKCLRNDGKYYWLNDGHFERNNISGHDAHQYRDRTKIVIK